MSNDFHNWPTLLWIHVWQLGVLGLIVGFASIFTARRWPHLAYALWLVVLVKCFVPPVGNWPVSIWSGWTLPLTLVNSIAEQSLVAPTTDSVSEPGFATAVQPSQLVTDTDAPLRAIPSKLNVANSAARSAYLAAVATQAAPYAWLAGSVLLCGIAIGRGSEIGRRLRRSSGPLSDDMLVIVEQVAKRLGLGRHANVLRTSTDIGPVVVGILRTKVYVPDVLLDSMQPSQVEAMLMHELAHVRRRDTWVAAVQFAAQALWWFHPIVWWMNRELVRQRERCCDEEVIANLQGRRSDYARLLVDVLDARHKLEPLWGYPAVRPVELTRRRLEEIMKRTNMVHVRAPRWCWMVAAGIALVVIPSAGPSTSAGAQREADAPRAAQNTNRPADRAASSARAPALLSYGDGKADGRKSYGGSGHMIRFELPEGVTKVRGLRIHGSRYGMPQAPDEDFEITFLSDDREETLDSQAAPYRLFKRGKESWVRVLFDKEVELPEKFWVALNFNAHQTKGVYLSYDTSTKGKHSLVGLVGDETAPKETDFGGDWMVQIMLPRPER